MTSYVMQICAAS